jgi:threonylcarbamoyladenosine tRNA methylthiotransferase MtaB
VSALPRLRLSSIDVAELDEEFFELFAQERRLMPHLHLSLQAGDDLILKRMKRRHLRDDVIRFCTKIREVRPNVVFGADIIAGFPTETDAMFQNTLNLLRDLNIIHLHVFPYSEREGTPAARMPQVDKRIRKERAAAIRALGHDLLSAHLQAQVGKTLNVLVENNSSAHTEDFSAVQIDDTVKVGAIVECAILAATEQHLQGAAML